MSCKKPLFRIVQVPRFIEDKFRNNLSFTSLFILLFSNDLIYSRALPPFLIRAFFNCNYNFTLKVRDENPLIN